MARRIIFLVLLLVAGSRVCAQTAPADSVAVLTLEQAIAEAQQNNRLLKIANQSVLSADDAVQAAKTQRYPQFNVQLMASGLLTAVNINIPQNTFGYVNGSPVPATNTTITTEPKFSALSLVQAYQPLTQLWSAHLNIQLLKVSKKLTEEQLRQQKQQIANSVKDTYYALLQTQSALEASEQNLTALREIDRTTEQYVQEKTALPYQGSSVRVQLAQAELQQVTLQDTLETQKENLNSLMGRDITMDFRLSPVPDALPEELDLQHLVKELWPVVPKFTRLKSKSIKRYSQDGFKRPSTFRKSAYNIFTFLHSPSKDSRRTSTRSVSLLNGTSSIGATNATSSTKSNVPLNKAS